MAKTALLRVWQQLDIEQVCSQLLVIGELSAQCEHCQQLDIDFSRQPVCPNCGQYFKYAGVRDKENRREQLSAIGRLREQRPDLIIIDYDDVKRAVGKSKARDLLG